MPSGPQKTVNKKASNKVGKNVCQVNISEKGLYSFINKKL